MIVQIFIEIGQLHEIVCKVSSILADLFNTSLTEIGLINPWSSIDWGQANC